MTIKEILYTHQLFWRQGETVWRCECGKWEDDTCAQEENHRAHVAEVLEKHAQEREADAVRETSIYLQRIFPRKGLINRADILADIEIAADRLGRGIHANGREKDQS